MKPMTAVESDSVKSARKAKDSCTRPVKERQKLVSLLFIGRNKTMRMASIRECSQHTSIITCTAAPRVWQFSAFHLLQYTCMLCYIAILWGLFISNYQLFCTPRWVTTLLLTLHLVLKLVTQTTHLRKRAVVNKIHTLQTVGDWLSPFFSLTFLPSGYYIVHALQTCVCDSTLFDPSSGLVSFASLFCTLEI